MDNQVVNANFVEFIWQLSRILSNVENSEELRMQAGIKVKNLLFSYDMEQKMDKERRWLLIGQHIRNEIKRNCFNALRTQDQGFHSAALCVASIASIEIPVNQWPNVIPSLLFNITGSTATESLKQASLEALGYICNEINANILASQSDNILSGIVFGMRKEEPSNLVKKAAFNALLNSLNVITDISSNQDLFHLICESTLCDDIEVAVIALQCFARMMSRFYGHMEQYMPMVIGITLGEMTSYDDAMTIIDDAIVLQGIEFWSTVCEVEIELALEAAQCRERGVPPPDIQCKNYARGALKHLVPIMLRILEHQEEGDDEDEYNPRKAAGVCLALLAKCCEESIVELVLPYVQEHIEHQDWRLRDSAVMAFGSILEGPSPSSLEGIVGQAMPKIIDRLWDQSPVVRNSGAWTVGRVCEVLPEVALNDECLPSLLQAMVLALSRKDRVATKVCWAIGSLAEGAFKVAMNALAEHDDHEQQIVPVTYKLSNYFVNLVQPLLLCANSGNCGQSDLPNAAYSALMKLTKNAPRDCHKCILETAILMLDLLHKMQDRLMPCQIEEDHAWWFSTLYSQLQKLTLHYGLMDDIARVLIGVLQFAQNAAEGDINHSEVQADAMLAFCALIESIMPHIVKHLPDLMKVLEPCLRNVAEPQICGNALIVVEDLAGHLGEYLDTIFEILDDIFRKPGTPWPLLPLVVRACGNLALELGSIFSQYRTNFLLLVIERFEKAEADLNNVEYISAFGGLIMGALSYDPGLFFMLDYLERFFDCVLHIGNEEESYELISDCLYLLRFVLASAAAATLGDKILEVYNTAVKSLDNKFYREDEVR